MQKKNLNEKLQFNGLICMLLPLNYITKDKQSMWDECLLQC